MNLVKLNEMKISELTKLAKKYKIIGIGGLYSRQILKRVVRFMVKVPLKFFRMVLDF